MGEQPASVRRLPPPPRQMSMTWAQPRETNFPADSQSLSQQDRAAKHEDEVVAAFANQLACRVDGPEMELRPVANLASIAKAAIRRDIATFGTTMGASEAGRQ